MTKLSIPNASNTLIIGITGHRNLLEKDWHVTLDPDNKPVPGGYLLTFVETKLEAIRRDNPTKKLLLLTGMAEGADLLAAQVAQQLNIPLVAVLAAEMETFLASFQDEAERKLCRHLLSQATKIVSCTKQEEVANYEAVGLTIAQYADEMITLWNGVDTGLNGGTWEVVRMALMGKNSVGKRLPLFRSNWFRPHPFRLHHLLTPRQNSPLPLPRYFDMTSLQSVLPLGTSYSWSVLTRDRKSRGVRFLSWLQSFWVEHRRFFLKSIMPALLFLATVVLGTWGLMDYQQQLEQIPEGDRPKDFHEYNWLGAFYKALKLEAIFPPPYDWDAAGRSTLFKLGKYMGMVFFLYAFFGLTLKALGDSPRRRWFRFWWGKWRVPFTKTYVGLPYSLILGLNESSYSTLTSLRERFRRVMALEPNHDSPYYETSQRKGGVVIGDNSNAPGTLKKIRFYEANDVYLLGSDDSRNIHLVQQMDRWVAERGKPPIKSNWYVQVQDPIKRQFLTRFTHKQPKIHIYAFNLYETIARRLLLQYPIDRFYRNPQATSTNVFIFGFGEMGQQIALNCLKLGHFETGKKLNLHIYTADPVGTGRKFQKQYPFLDGSGAPFNQPGLPNELVQDVFGHVTTTFHYLPKTDYDLLQDDFPLYKAANDGQIIGTYFCMENEFNSASYLGILLDRLAIVQAEQLRQDTLLSDIQNFCYYNFPDEEESALVERHFNELAPHVPVVCFGDVQHECSARSLKDRALDQFAQLTSLYYDEVIDKKGPAWNLEDSPSIKERAAEKWVGRTEMIKESSRLFADHALAKMRQEWGRYSDTDKAATEDATLTIARELQKKLNSQPAANHTELGKLEHRRWAAAKLFDGYVPLETEREKIKEYESKWANDDPYKKQAISQKRHLDLIPANILYELGIAKDLPMIKGIPLFVEFLREATPVSP